MRLLANGDPSRTVPMTLVPMREKCDCLTCITAMLLGITYEEVEAAFGGNLNPTSQRESEEARLFQAFTGLLEKHHRGIIQIAVMPEIKQGRRYWVSVQINDPSNPLSQTMSHSIAVDENGKVFDPNPQYGEFESLKLWRQAIPHGHEILFANEIFEYSL